MTTTNYKFRDEGDHILIASDRASSPIVAWIKGVPIEDAAIEQLCNVANLPIVKRIAVMPDVHLGKGATVGSVIATKGGIIPAAVGVDIGCGMMAAKLPIKSAQLPDNLGDLRASIEAMVPTGVNSSPIVGHVKGTWNDEKMPEANRHVWTTLERQFKRRIKDDKKFQRALDRAPRQLGTLGGGNHFIEVSIDDDDNVWIVLHTGSRGIGHAIGSYYIELAKREASKLDVRLPDRELAFIADDAHAFDDYRHAVLWAQRYAKANRDAIFREVLAACKKHIDALSHITLTSQSFDMVVDCHHNYIAEEVHDGESVFVTRKGAVRARKHDIGIIPGSMGTRTYIVRGRGDPRSLCSCAHGAGRRMSRNVARKVFTLDDHREATMGVECRKDAGVLDETPLAYKDIDAVMNAQKSLVEVITTLKQVLCVKG